MTMLLEFLERHRARHLFRSSHLNPTCKETAENKAGDIHMMFHDHRTANEHCIDKN